MNSEEVRELVDHHAVVTLQADLTNDNPEGEALKEQFVGPSGGIPLIVIYPGGRPDEPIALVDFPNPLFRPGAARDYVLGALRDAVEAPQPTVATEEAEEGLGS